MRTPGWPSSFPLRTRGAVALASALLFIGVGATGSPLRSATPAAAPPARCDKNDVTGRMPSYNRKFFETKARSWAHYSRRVAQHKGGYVLADGGPAPRISQQVPEVALYPHDRLCTVSATGADNEDGQAIGYLQYIGEDPNNEYKLAPGEIGFLVVKREHGVAALLLMSSEGEKLAGWAFLVCHRGAHNAPKPPNYRVGGPIVPSTYCDAPAPGAPSRESLIKQAKSQNPGVPGAKLHDESPWFACDEGCCHVVEW